VTVKVLAQQFQRVYFLGPTKPVVTLENGPLEWFLPMMMLVVMVMTVMMKDAGTELLCCVQIKKIIDDAINIPDEDNDWMREQLRELAVINGTLRDSDTIKYVKTCSLLSCSSNV